MEGEKRGAKGSKGEQKGAKGSKGKYAMYKSMSRRVYSRMLGVIEKYQLYICTYNNNNRNECC